MAESDYKLFWEETMNQLREETGEEEFTIWFGNIAFLGVSETGIRASVPSAFFREQFQPRYLPRLEEKLRELTGKAVPVSLEVAPKDAARSPEKAVETKAPWTHPPKAPPQAPQTKPRGRHPQLREEFTFDKFIVGDANAYAANAAKAIAANPGSNYNPFLIYGGVGLGKTHLMQAIGNCVHGNSDLRVTYITGENFLNEFTAAIKANSMPAFKNKFRYSTDILLMDDIQFFQGKEGIQEELYHTFNALLDVKKQVVFTCDRPASELKSIPERLLSRFDSGVKVDLQPPKYETRRAILQAINESAQAGISNDVIDIISKNISSNVRDLISSFNNLVAYQRLMEKNITVEIAQQQLGAAPKQSNISIDNILKTVAGEYNLSSKDLRNKKRNKNIVFPRHIAMYLARELTEYSTTEIGQEFGRDHTTVIAAVRKIETELKIRPDMYSILESLKRQIRDNSVKS